MSDVESTGASSDPHNGTEVVAATAKPRDPDPAVWQILAAEALGTFILVFLGCGAAVVSSADITSTGLAFGIAIIISATAFGRISGGHFNPAVTVGIATSGRLAWRATPVYFAGQLIGAIVGALALFIVLHGIPGFTTTGHMGQNAFGSQTKIDLAWWSAFLVEAVLTAVFLWVILSVTDARNKLLALAPVAIGLALAAIHFVGIPLTGTSVNPARSIGPALFAGGDAIVQLWLFILAPLVGAVIAGVTYPLLFGRDAEPVEGSGLTLPQRPVRPATASTPAWSQVNEHTSESPLGAPQPPQRIIQDGWEWDYAAQQWKPLQEPDAQN
ncbi:aquaporin [Nocardioides sp.]|uniref:MIP/aquaporin family protein n=1 Tax=Nocardioides sp. TaxID=35761 RepID=UPI002627278A|nr:aquaporin [Nocardioides sp.]